MAHILRMPEIAANAVEATLANWLVAEGSAFTTGQSLAVVETEKAAVDLEAESDGVLLSLLVQNGAQVDVGSPIALVGDSGETGTDIAAALAALGVSAKSDAVPISSEVPNGSESKTPPSPTVPAGTPDSARIFASPLARKMARDSGIALEGIAGTGPGRRIVRRDIRAAIKSASNTQTVNVAPGTSSQYEDIPHTRMRKAIAARLSHSKQTAPHFYLRGTCRVDALLQARAILNEQGTAKLSINDLLIKAIAKAHTLVPAMNVTWGDDATRHFKGVDISVAIATEIGLVTPVILGAEALSLTEISSQVSDFISRARVGQIQPAELDGGSITITNLGMFGAEEFSAILNPPQAAILAVGAVTREPVVNGDRIEIASVLRVVLSVDHRPVDGATAARWMQKFVSIIENPILLFS
jgi:pyruvate dehydrogenase E2 component (dihydrolipoamide acetyltransferase)